MINLYPDELLEDITWNFTGDQFSSLKEFNNAVRKYQENNAYWHPEVTILNAPQVKIRLLASNVDADYMKEYLLTGDLFNEHLVNAKEPEVLVEVVLIADNNKSFTAGELFFKIHNAFVVDKSASLLDGSFDGPMYLEDLKSENILPTYYLFGNSMLREADQSVVDTNNNDLHKPKSNINCPNCNSDEWKLAAIIYQNGLTHVNTSSNSVGVGVSSGIGVGVGYSDTVGQHQTELSRLAAPPERHHSSSTAAQGLGYITFLVSCPLFYFFSSTSFLDAAFKAFLLSCLAVLIGVFTGIDNQYDKSLEEKYKKEKDNWEKKKVCTRCGTFYY